MDDKLKQKFDTAMREYAKKLPTSARYETVKESEERKKQTRAEFDEIRLSFTGNEIDQLRERYKEIEPKMPPISHRSNIQTEVESQPYEHTYELYFLTRLLDF